MDSMKAQLLSAQSEADQNKLIPHYRLAILRSRGHAANLAEQLQREQVSGFITRILLCILLMLLSSLSSPQRLCANN
jgi:hypothetical protein